jgi:hypothetical protein
MTGSLLVGGWLFIGLKLVGGSGVWHLNWAVAFIVTLVLWLPCAGGYASLRQLFSMSANDRDTQVREIALESLVGMPLLVVSFFWSLLVLGAFRFLGSFGEPPRGGVLNLVMAVVALHVIAWGGTGLTQWSLASWRARRDG